MQIHHCLAFFFFFLLSSSISFLIEKTVLNVQNMVLLNTTTPCHIYVLQANFQTINLEIKEYHSLIKRLMISDQPLFSTNNSCNKESFSSCQPNSSYCLILNEPESDFNYAMGICTDKIYLHIYAELSSSHSPVDGDEAHTKKEAETEYTLGSLISTYNYSRKCTSTFSKDNELAMKCATMSQEQCYSDDQCDEQCQWISCTYNSNIQKDLFKEFTLCLPANIYAENVICYDHYDFVNSPNKRFSFKKCGYPLNAHKMPGNEGVTAGTVAIFILIIFIILFIISIFYYRMNLKHRKVAPFTPPNFCPDWIYPRVGVEHPKLKEMMKKNEYKPPND